MPPGNDNPPTLSEQVARCRSDERFLGQLRAIYASVDAAVAEASPSCRGCGECCRFERAGHKLYVSIGELALLAGQPLPSGARAEAGRCPYQVGARCAAREGRALGCRVHFCNPPARGWCEETYERFHTQIRVLHDRLGLPYAYIEMTGALAELGQSM
ncbi:MAG: hypothetical protein WC869_04315 [Phycisphaerae bacterium]